MKKTILIEKTTLFTRVAVMLDDELTATYMESSLNPDHQNKIIIGQIEKVIKNLNAAFVDYGETKKGLLHLSQVPAVYRDKIHQGNRIPIQIVKQNEGEKGHKLTAKISLKGKYLVCLPFEKGISVSKKIRSQSQRTTLKEALKTLPENQYGFIVRTHAEHIKVQDIKEDAMQIIEKADRLLNIKDNLSKGSVLYEEYPMYIQIAVENINMDETVEIICDDECMTESLKQILCHYRSLDESFSIRHFNKKEDLFQSYGIQKELTSLENRKIWLKNGGNIFIDYTEALTVIDVNSAKAILSSNQRKAVLDLNQLAVKEAILQVSRRNLSGIVVLDLVEMPHVEDKEQIYLFAKKFIQQIKDNRTTVLPLTELGLLQISRSKKYTSIPRNLFSVCPTCHTFGGTFSNEYQAYLIEKKVKYIAFQTNNKEMTVECSREMNHFLQQHNILESIENKYQIKLNMILSENSH